MLTFFKEYTFNIRGKNLHAQAWGHPDERPVLALHGWLDNSNSFAPLANHLDNLFLVAVDMAGHGLSDHRSEDAGYNIWQETFDIFAIADQLGWDTFSLLGHSRGGICAIISAGTFPKRIDQLILLDALVPVDTANQNNAARQLAKSIQHLRRLELSKRTIYPTQDDLVQARIDSPMGLSHKSATLMAERSLEKVQDGYCWRYDPRLKSASEVRYTEEQYRAFLDNIICPTLVVLAEDSSLREPLEGIYHRLLAQNKHFQQITLAGSHHFHMEDESVSAVAQTINNFLEQ